MNTWRRSHAELISASVLECGYVEYDGAITFWKTAEPSSKSRVAKKCLSRCSFGAFAHALATAVNDGSNSL